MRKVLKNMARPEGFEPPTPRSVVSSDAQSQETKWKTSSEEPPFFSALPCDMVPLWAQAMGTSCAH